MATYVIGDLQGCYASLQLLLAQIAFDPARDEIVLAGDLVNRGPGSLAVLRWAVEHGREVDAVLGNHDLHLLARAFGGAKGKSKDTLDEVLHAPDARVLLGWLRRRPLLIEHGRFVITHAGLYPRWSMAETRQAAHELEAVLQGELAGDFFRNMYGGEPCRWSPSLTGYERLRFATNAFTRMRMLNRDGSIDLAFKGDLAKAPPDLTPWFDFATPGMANRPVVIFGHWSALGLLVREDVIALDTGCVWGGALSAVRLEDRAIFQVPCQDGAAPFDE